MKRLLSAFFALLVGALVVHADTTTPRMGLTVPSIGSSGYAPKINNDLSLIDTKAGVLDMPNVWTGLNTFSNMSLSGNLGGSIIFTGTTTFNNRARFGGGAWQAELDSSSETYTGLVGEDFCLRVNGKDEECYTFVNLEEFTIDSVDSGTALTVSGAAFLHTGTTIRQGTHTATVTIWSSETPGSIEVDSTTGFTASTASYSDFLSTGAATAQEVANALSGFLTFEGSASYETVADPGLVRIHAQSIVIGAGSANSELGFAEGDYSPELSFSHKSDSLTGTLFSDDSLIGGGPFRWRGYVNGFPWVDNQINLTTFNADEVLFLGNYAAFGDESMNLVQFTSDETNGGTITNFFNGDTLLTFDKFGLTISDGASFPGQIMPVDGGLSIKKRITVGENGTPAASNNPSLHVVGPSGPVASFPSGADSASAVIEDNGAASLAVVGSDSVAAELNFFKSGSNNAQGGLSYNFTADEMYATVGEALSLTFQAGGIEFPDTTVQTTAYIPFGVGLAVAGAADGDMFYTDSSVEVAVSSGPKFSVRPNGGTKRGLEVKAGTGGMRTFTGGLLESAGNGIHGVFAGASGTTGAGEDTLYTITIASNTLDQGGASLEFEFSGHMANNGNTKQVRVYLSGTQIYTLGPTAFDNIDWLITGRCIRSGSTGAMCHATTIAGTTVTGVGSLDWGNDEIFHITGEGTDSNDVVVNTVFLQYFPGTTAEE